MKKTGMAKTLYALFFGATIFFMLFVLLEFRESYFAVAASGVVFLIAGYLLLDCLQKEKQKQEQMWESIKSVIEVQKALYVATKKNGELLQQSEERARNTAAEVKLLLQQITENQNKEEADSKKYADMQVSALKVVAKYERENAHQLAVGAAENTERMIAGLKNIPDTVRENMEQSLHIMQETVEERYQEMADVMLSNTVAMSERIENALKGVEKKEEGFAEATVEKPEPVEDFPAIEPVEEPEPLEEPVVEEELSEEPMIDLPEIELEPIVEEAPVEEELPVEEAPKPATPELSSDPNHAMTPDEIAALLASMGGEEPAVEEEPSEEPIIDLPEIELEPIVEEALPVEEAPKPVTPELSSDPNHAMTPDEITALLASMGGEEPAVEEEPSEEPIIDLPEIEPEPIVEEAPVEEELPVEEEPKPAAPELSSDPNHAMTPDEIAALIASMGQ